MTDREEINNIISEFQRLQLQQTILLNRLQQLDTGATRGGTSNTTRRTTPAASPATARALAVGDRVKVRNPNLFQATSGTIEKIGSKRVTVRGTDGKPIHRAPKNLQRYDE